MPARRRPPRSELAEARRAIAELTRRLAYVEEATRARDEFLATLSHELRTPLSAIVGWTHVLRTAGPDSPSAAQALDAIERSARAQGHVIADLLDVSRIVSGRLRLAVRETDLARVVEAALATVRPMADARGVRLVAVLDDAGTVSGDPDRLQQVVWNLVALAVGRTAPGGRVVVTVARARSSVEVRLEDSGPRPDAEEMAALFTRVLPRRTAELAEAPSSALLGPALVRRLVELHGGTVRASAAGAQGGARFTVRLPLLVTADSDFSRVHPTAEDQPPTIEAPSLAGISVLAVDDEPDARALITAVLQARGAQVLTAGSAEEAMTAIGRQPPDVLLSDIEMPVEDGYRFIRRVRALPREGGGAVPAAALTAYARLQDRLQVLLAGFQMHLPKPVQPVELATVVASLAGRTRS